MVDVYLSIILLFFVLGVQCIIYDLPQPPKARLQARGPSQSTQVPKTFAMVSRVDPDTWLSTAEFFRASLPHDQLPDGRGGPDRLARYYREAHPPVQGALKPEWLETRPVDGGIGGMNQGYLVVGPRTVDGWDATDTQPRGSPQIIFGRRRLPPTVDGVVVCKTRSRAIEHRSWATYAEIRALNAVRQYYTDNPNQFRHIPVPRVYTHSFQPPESGLVYNRLERGFIIMEHIKDNRYLHSVFPDGNRGWTPRQRRRFVRKMALIRLQLLFIRNGRNGVELPIQDRGTLATVLNKKAPKAGGSTTLWEPRFNPPYPNNRAWVEAQLAREHAYWQAVVSHDSLAHLVPNMDQDRYNEAQWFGDFRALQDAFRNSAGHIFRDEPFHVLSHEKLTHPERSILMKGKNISCIVDWESSGYLPASESVKDMLKQYRGGGQANPENWPDDNATGPFSTCLFWGWTWDDWIENMRINRWQLENTWNREQVSLYRVPRHRRPFADRFSLYGRISPNDFRYGDKYADQDIGEEEGPRQYTLIRNPVGITRVDDVLYTSNENTALVDAPDMDWWQAPVMHLVDDYVRTYSGFPETWSWPDPVLEEYARHPIELGESLAPP